MAVWSLAILLGLALPWLWSYAAGDDHYFGPPGASRWQFAARDNREIVAVGGAVLGEAALGSAGSPWSWNACS